jgi:anti-sigma-K factor RskA
MTHLGDHDREHDGDDGLAAEYVLGVLPADERRSAARRIESDAAFAGLVEQWEERLSPLSADYGEAAPPASIKQELDRRLFSRAAQRLPPATRMWQSLNFWRGLAAAAVLALAVLMAGLIALPRLQAPAPQFVAALAADNSDVRYLAVYDAAQARISLAHVAGARAANRDFELWSIEPGQSPVSLGVIPMGETVELKLPRNLPRLPERNVSLAISLEPQGGSPTGQPTGPVVAVGELRKM